jgi:site-specific DNA-cytosine methylase
MPSRTRSLWLSGAFFFVGSTKLEYCSIPEQAIHPLPWTLCMPLIRKRSNAMSAAHRRKPQPKVDLLVASSPCRGTTIVSVRAVVPTRLAACRSGLFAILPCKSIQALPDLLFYMYVPFQTFVSNNVLEITKDNLFDHAWSDSPAQTARLEPYHGSTRHLA